MKEGCGARCVTGCKEGSHHEDEALAGALVRGVQPAEHWALLPEVRVLDCFAYPHGDTVSLLGVRLVIVLEELHAEGVSVCQGELDLTWRALQAGFPGLDNVLETLARGGTLGGDASHLTCRPGSRIGQLPSFLAAV